MATFYKNRTFQSGLFPFNPDGRPYDVRFDQRNNSTGSGIAFIQYPDTYAGDGSFPISDVYNFQITGSGRPYIRIVQHFAVSDFIWYGENGEEIASLKPGISRRTQQATFENEVNPQEGVLYVNLKDRSAADYAVEIGLY